MANVKLWISKGLSKGKGMWFKIISKGHDVRLYAKNLDQARLTFHKATGGSVVEDIILASEEEQNVLDNLKFK